MEAKAVKLRKTPMQKRSAQMVETIVEAAARVLERHGLDGYTTNAVAEAAGVSVGSLYQYFPRKEALTVALIEREMAMVVADMAEVATIDDARDALRCFITICAAHQLRRPELARLLDFEEQRLPMGEHNEAIATDLTQIILPLLRRLSLTADTDLALVAADILAIVKAMVDGAGERGETNRRGLEKRVGRAVFGYLGESDAA